MIKKLSLLLLICVFCMPAYSQVVDLRDNPSDDTPSDYPEVEYAPPPVKIENENATVPLLRNEDNTNPYTPPQYRSLHTNEPPPPGQ